MTFVHFILSVLLYICLLNVIYETFQFCIALYKTTEFKTTTVRRVLLCLSLAYIITVFSIGFPV